MANPITLKMDGRNKVHQHLSALQPCIKVVHGYPKPSKNRHLSESVLAESDFACHKIPCSLFY